MQKGVLLGGLGAIIAIAALIIVLVVGGKQGETGPTGAGGTSVGTISGTITNAAGTGIDGASVVTDPISAEAHTDASGAYTVSNVPIGVYTVIATASDYNANAQANVSVTAGQTSTVNLALADAAPFPLFSIGGVGLSNVGVGTEVQLQGKTEDEHGTAISAYSWTLTGPAESTATLDSATAQNPKFTPDKKGKYIVKLTATTSSTAESAVVITAGTYVGVTQCAQCHSGNVMPDMVSKWQETGHATKFEKSSYSASSTCFTCHTTGWTGTASSPIMDNGGFDDLAQGAGWVPSSQTIGAWVVSKGLPWIQNNIPGDLINIQCESCHGPGSMHTGAKSFSAGACATCHGESRQYGQWQYSGHATGDYVGSNYLHTAESTDCAKCHTGQGYVVGQIRGQALVFPNMAYTGNPANMMLPGDQQGITCAACHDPHQFTYGESGASHQLRTKGEVTMPNGTTVDAEFSATCVNCHANKRDAQYMADFVAGTLTRGVHGNSQADVFYGVGAVTYGQTFTSSKHTTVATEGCVQCHMAPNPVTGPGTDGLYATSHGNVVEKSVGGHSWNMSSSTGLVVNGTTYNDNVGWWMTEGGSEVSLGGACNTAGCHKALPLTSFDRTAFADYDGDGTVEAIQLEVQGLLNALAAQLPQKSGDVLSSGNEIKTATEAQRQALWNYWLIRNDGSLGIHNTAFAVQVLQTTYQQLTGNALPGAAAYAAASNIPHDATTVTCNTCHAGTTVGHQWPSNHPSYWSAVSDTSSPSSIASVCKNCHTWTAGP